MGGLIKQAVTINEDVFEMDDSSAGRINWPNHCNNPMTKPFTAKSTNNDQMEILPMSVPNQAHPGVALGLQKSIDFGLSISHSESCISSRSALDKRVILYKTEICRTFEETGLCKYGIRCQFAHSQEELRPTPRHPRYKTEICRTFWEQGTCPYGKRCCFIHNDSKEIIDGLPHKRHSISIPIKKNSSKILPRIEMLSSTPIFQLSESWNEAMNRNFSNGDIDNNNEDLWSKESVNNDHLPVDVLRLIDD